MEERVNEHKKFDVGVFGVWSGCNYGSVATYYALNRVLQSYGKTVLMIDKPILSESDVELKETHARRFARERYNISKQYYPDQLHQLNALCDAFVIGSDQVWNYGISRNFGKAFYLDFAAEEKKKIAYGVSFGHGSDFAPATERNIIAEYMSYFDGIGTREDDGVRICREDYGIKAQQVLDPVFLADPKIYDELIDKSKYQEEEPYILSYILDPTPEKRRALLYLQEKMGGIKIINVLDGLPWLFEKNKKLTDLPNCMENVEIEEWLYFLKNAKFVFTDSCHGASFALIFQKNFIAITNRHRGFSRFMSLSKLFKFEDHLITNPLEVLDNPVLREPINYDVVNAVMKQEKERCGKWLEDKINQPKKTTGELQSQNIIGKVNPITRYVIEKLKGEISEEKSINRVINAQKCAGCGTCALVCPKEAISMKTNEQGFLVPYVNRMKCITCNVCVKKCPSINPQYKNSKEPTCMAMMASDEVRKVSSSGGMFTVAAEYILENGGYVCGAAYKEDFKVEHIIINDISDLWKLRGSKYMQSDLSDIYKQIKQLLLEQKAVLFTGMPCQVAGLYSYLGKDFDNLYTIDLLCHGITSSKVFEKYHADVLEAKELKRLEFKEKEPWGWHAGVNAYFCDGSKYSKPLERDPYFIAYLKSLAKNTTCGTCSANKLPRQGDITIGDFWGIARKDPDMYDKKGTSVVLLNNKKGSTLFDILKPKMKAEKKEPLSYAIAGNKIIQGPYKLHKNRNLFFENFDKFDFADLTDGCFNNHLYSYQRIELNKKLPEKFHEYYFLAKTVSERCKGRKIVTWIKSNEFETILKKFFDLEVEFAIAKTNALIDNNKVYPLSKIKGEKERYYVVVLDVKKPEDSVEVLSQYGYTNIQDYICKFHKPIKINNYDLAKGNYFDEYGNSIEGFSGTISSVIFRGGNNHIIIGKDNKGLQNISFDITSNCFIEIGNNNSFNAENKFITRGTEGNSCVTIRNNCRFTDVLYRLYNNKFTSSILINDSCTFESHIEMHANSGKKIIIGKDCMFSHGIDLWAGDGHSMFDVSSGHNINSIYNKLESEKNLLVLGDHVWVSKGCFIMHGTNIGTGSTVGAQSVVKGKFYNNCTLAGNPAKIIKEDSAWSRKMCTESILDCGKEYVHISSHASAAISGKKVLVIGGTRFMGVYLVQRLIELGNEVYIATRGRKKDNFGTDVHRILMDVSSYDSVKEAIGTMEFDVVFDNLAYCSNYVNNVLSNVKCKRYIQLSSIATYINRKVNICEEEFDPYNNPMKWVGEDAGYVVGKRQAEDALYQKFDHVSGATIRIPYVTKTERLYFYCEHIAHEIPMNIKNPGRIFNFVSAEEIGTFLPWIAAQPYEGPLNFASDGIISLDSIIKRIEEKTQKKAIIDCVNGDPAPFSEYEEASFSLNLSKVKTLGYSTSDINEWFWNLLDLYIERALRNKK